MSFKKLNWSDFKKYFYILLLIFFGFVMSYSGTILAVRYFGSAMNYMGVWAFSLIAPLSVGVCFVIFGVIRFLEATKFNE